MTVGVAHTHAQSNPVSNGRAGHSPLQRIRVGVVYALSVAVELVAKKVVVETSVGSSQRRVAVGRPEVSSIGAKTEFRDRSVPVRVQTCTTLVMASEPYNVLCAPRTNSRRSACAAAAFQNQNVSPASLM